MKRLSALFVALVLMAGSSYGAESIDQILDAAYANEIIVKGKYLAFAAKADEEGYAGAASLFRAAARGEEIHAKRFAALMKKRGMTVEEPAFLPTVKTTHENLLVAMEGEREERDHLYLADVQVAKAANEREVANAFELARTAETEHANLFTAVNATLEQQKNPKTYHVCSHCGYTTDVKLGKCPSCMHANAEMIPVR
jgi:rubrerythrin